MAVDRDGMVCTWQTDYSPNELELDFKRTRKEMFSPTILKRLAKQNTETKIEDEIGETENDAEKDAVLKESEAETKEGV